MTSTHTTTTHSQFHCRPHALHTLLGLMRTILGFPVQDAHKATPRSWHLMPHHARTIAWPLAVGSPHPPQRSERLGYMTSDRPASDNVPPMRQIWSILGRGYIYTEYIFRRRYISRISTIHLRQEIVGREERREGGSPQVFRVTRVST